MGIEGEKNIIFKMAHAEEYFIEIWEGYLDDIMYAAYGNIEYQGILKDWNECIGPFDIKTNVVVDKHLYLKTLLSIKELTPKFRFEESKEALNYMIGFFKEALLNNNEIMVEEC